MIMTTFKESLALTGTSFHYLREFTILGIKLTDVGTLCAGGRECRECPSLNNDYQRFKQLMLYSVKQT